MTEKTIKTVTEQAREYHQRHPKRGKATWFANQYPDKIEILHRCPCEAEWRVKHHPNYDFPYKVMNLCARCHKQLHASIYQWNKDPFRNQKWIESLLITT